MALSDEQLAECIRILDHAVVLVESEWGDASQEDQALYDVETELNRLRAENAAMRPIVEAVAAIKEGGDGWGDNRPYDAQITLLTISQARALLAKEE
jgi:hypothetical protein